MIHFVGYRPENKMIIDKDTGEIFRFEGVRVNFTDDKCFNVVGLDVQSYTIFKSEIESVFGVSREDDLFPLLGLRCVLSFRMNLKNRRSFLNKVEFIAP